MFVVIFDDVKPRFPRRQQRARATRRAVLDAAGLLFIAHGYGATTIQAIADEAGVAVQTVYAVFGNKPTILAELLDVSIAGDDEQIAVNDREWMRQVWEAPTAAAATSPDVTELAETTEQRRRLGATSVIDSIRKAASSSRPELDNVRPGPRAPTARSHVTSRRMDVVRAIAAKTAV